jgi:hypothetical protein
MQVIKHMLRMPVLPLTIVGLVALGLGGFISGGFLLVGAAGWAAKRANSTTSLLGEALAGTSVVLDAQLIAQLSALGPTLSRARMMSGAEQVGLQAFEQFRNLVTAFLSYRKILRHKFDSGEMTHGRYLKAGEQVFLSALDDLNQAGTQLEALATMDIERMRAQRRQLERITEPDDASSRELESLQQRFAEHDSQMQDVRGKLASNEDALTQLAAASGALSRIKTQQGMAQLESDTAMQQLEEMSARAKIYAVDKQT